MSIYSMAVCAALLVIIAITCITVFYLFLKVANKFLYFIEKLQKKKKNDEEKKTELDTDELH